MYVAQEAAAGSKSAVQTVMEADTSLTDLREAEAALVL
jgi:hypothetical protein